MEKTKKQMSQMEKNKKGLSRLFDTFSTKVTKLSGSPGAFITALVTIIVWAITGPVFNYSDTWQLVINTGTTIITFLMVFLIQQSQNKDTLALQIKLNELIAANQNASNRLIDSEDLTGQELEMLKNFYIKMSERAKKEQDLRQTHSIEDAVDDEKAKEQNQKNRPLKPRKAKKS
ncbi:MAG TPA: low affinity iron permease family protein [Chitinophagaceae bacterium]|jgi:low affinity Fe/Cu permease